MVLSKFVHKNQKSKQKGFALPTVLIVSVTMLGVLLVSLSITWSSRQTLKLESDNQNARNAAVSALNIMDGCMLGSIPYSSTITSARLDCGITTAPASINFFLLKPSYASATSSFGFSSTASGGLNRAQLVTASSGKGSATNGSYVQQRVLKGSSGCKNADPTSACAMQMDNNLIPVKYTGSTTTAQWQIADTHKEGDWYDYSKKQWANAVAVTAAQLNNYKTGTPGKIVSESHIVAYYTYIPRYEYQVCRPNASDPISGITAPGCPSSVASPYNFNIRFQKPGERTEYDGVTVGGWATHPAFKFGDKELAGIWFGKYETSSPNAITSVATANAAVAAGKVTIKPNQNGISSQNISKIYNASLEFVDSTAPNYQNLNDATTSSRIINSNHWGAVAYLSSSVYGKGAGPSDVVHNNNCYKENNYNARTGWGGGASKVGSTTDCLVGVNNTGAYHTAQGRGASTTGNPTGIYDMSGGNSEYVLDNLNNIMASSTFTSLPGSEYAILYPSPPFSVSTVVGPGITNVNLCTWEHCGGKALHETKSESPVASGTEGSWNKTRSFFAQNGNPYPWMIRGGGGDTSDTSGIFAHGNAYGGADPNMGWRVVLSAK